MRRTSLLAVAVFCWAAVTAPWMEVLTAAPLDLKGKTLQQTFEELLPGMGSKEPGSRQSAQQRWQGLCIQAGAPGNEKARAEACKLMAGKLGTATPTPARLWLLKQLELIGRAESLDAIAALVADKDEQVRDAAVRCLATNPAPAATEKLLAKLPTAEGRTRVGVVNALGYRGDGTAVEVIARELSGKDRAVVLAAAGALGRIATPEAAQTLAKARGKAEGPIRLAITDAWLHHADRLLKGGKMADAAAIYRGLHKPGEPRPVRLAALRGVIRTSGDKAGPLILQVFAGADADARAVAVAEIEGLGAGALKTLATGIDKLPPAGQVLLLNGLAARGEKSQAAVAEAAAKSANQDVRRAGVRALGVLGDESAVGPLVQALYTPVAEAEAADALARLDGKGVNKRLLASLASEKTPVRVRALIGVLERRRATEAVPALLKAARTNDVGVRTAAFSGLKLLAEPKQVPALVSALLAVEKGKGREQAEEAVVAVCTRGLEAGKQADPVLATLAGLGKAERMELLPVLGRLGGPKALVVVKEALNSPEPALHAAGLVGLCNWPDASVSDDLLKLAKGEKDAGQRGQALRALIRVNALPGERPATLKLAALKEAMTLADRDQERRQVLEALGMARHIDTLRDVLPYLDQKNLAQSACRAVVDLAHSRMLREPNRAEFDKALAKVLAICKDSNLRDRARQYREAR